MIKKIYRFPSGSLIMYSYNDFSEIVLYNNKKVVYKFYGDTLKIGTTWNELIPMIEQDIVNLLKLRLQEINNEKGV